MNEKILRLIYDYSVSGKLVDRAYIEQLVDIVINSKGLNKYLRDIQFFQGKISDGDESMTLASYFPNVKTIAIYLNGIISYLHSSNVLECFLNFEETFFYKNMLITQVLLHELEHVDQYKKIETSHDSESEILKVSLARSAIANNDERMRKLLESGISLSEIMIYIKANQKKYEQNYETAPEERLAEIRSHGQLINIVNAISDYIPHLILIEQISILRNMIRGYEIHESGIIISPTINYLHSCGYGDRLKTFSWYSENYIDCIKKSSEMYSLSDRAMYGLPITGEEFYHIEEDIQYKISELR